MPYSTISSLANSTRSSAYFTEWITCPHIWSFQTLQGLPSLRYSRYKLNTISYEQQQPCLIPSIFTCLVSSIQPIQGLSSMYNLKNKRPTWCHLLFYFTSYVLNMFRTLGLSSVRVAGWSLQHGHYSNPAAPNLQHTTSREQKDRCGNSTAQSQAPDDGYINVRNMLST